MLGGPVLHRGRSHGFRRKDLQDEDRFHAREVAILSLSNISFNYPEQAHFGGLRNISFDLAEGEVLALVGKSGSGKTTLLKCIYGLEDLAGGTITIDGEKVLGPSWNLLPGNPHMKLVTQDYYVLENHTVAENIRDKLAGFTEEYKQRRTATILKLLDLAPLAPMRARMLSSGQRQRVAIARALAVIPKVLLLDEPFSNLDKILAEKLFAFITAEVKRKRTSVILITHVPEEALKYADAIAVMHDGRILQVGEKWKVYYKPKHRRLAALLGDYNVINSDDLERSSRAHFPQRVFARPDAFVMEKKDGDILLAIVSCTFNGKCYEVLGETRTGRNVLIYAGYPMKPGAEATFRLSPAGDAARTAGDKLERARSR